LVLVSENSLLEDCVALVPLNDGFKQVVSFSPFGLWHLMGGSFHDYERYSGVELLEAGMLLLSEPRIAI